MSEFNKIVNRLRYGLLRNSLKLCFILSLIFIDLFLIFEVKLNLVFVILISVFSSALISLIYYIIFRFKDYDIARDLDFSYNLNEKISTLVKYKDDKSDFATLQRNDANDQLKRITYKNKDNILLKVLLALCMLLSIFTIYKVSKDLENDNNLSSSENFSSEEISDDYLSSDVLSEISSEINSDISGSGENSGGSKGSENTSEEVSGEGESSEDSGSGSSGETQDESGGAGEGAGIGSGSYKYASDDKIYDPKTNSYVTYGELIDYYESLVLEGLVEGNFDDELESLISSYFSSLYNENYKQGEE